MNTLKALSALILIVIVKTILLPFLVISKFLKIVEGLIRIIRKTTDSFMELVVAEII